MNARWWDLKLLYQGIIPPIARDEKDFDPSSKYHVIADTPYIKYVCQPSRAAVSIKFYIRKFIS